MSDERGTTTGSTAVDDDRATTRSNAAGKPAIDVEKKAEGPAKPKSGIQKLIAWVMALRLVRVFIRFSSSGGEIMASGMSFQAVFAVFAGIWVGFSIFGIVLASNQALMDAVVQQLSNSIPGLIGEDGAIDPDMLSQARILGWTGAIALVGLVLTAIGWLASTRDSIRRIFKLDPPTTNPVILKLKDFGLALGFGIAIVLSSAVSLLSNQGLTIVFNLVGIDSESPVALFVAWLVGVLVVFAFDSLVLGVAFRVLSGVKIPLRRLVVGAVIGGAALGVLKILGSLLLGGATSNPLLASFAVIIGIMIFLNLVCRVILVSATWIAVGMDDAGIDPRALSPEQMEVERQQRVADARDTLVSAERERLRNELTTTHGLARRRVRKKLERLEKLDRAEALKLSKKL
ncbi:YihY/virulence factor BrkB family protein [Herbiconiux sp. CPCC 205763]|uniref:YihY/virulence factor BrkB family protein n=1 Tax=Herbiconiux aconitum TaxID=2970913 RepID=A0ABT2GKF5_9MICO|nr:YhjD/YihY/BrkB family envelope integrity protein [Herbiconiux aconitum]MCS5716695.1 YihY/virulence factor BrkB family protein [Herbiconiux aconitum]